MINQRFYRTRYIEIQFLILEEDPYQIILSQTNKMNLYIQILGIK